MSAASGWGSGKSLEAAWAQEPGLAADLLAATRKLADKDKIQREGPGLDKSHWNATSRTETYHSGVINVQLAKR